MSWNKVDFLRKNPNVILEIKHNWYRVVYEVTRVQDEVRGYFKFKKEIVDEVQRMLREIVKTSKR